MLRSWFSKENDAERLSKAIVAEKIPRWSASQHGGKKLFGMATRWEHLID